MSSYSGFEQPQDANTQFTLIDFICRSALSGMATMTLVQVKAVNAGARTVDVQPMVAQIDGDGNAMHHGIIYGLPYGRIQGGNCALVIDPVVGDIGVCAFASRDISTVKATKAPALPGSRRSYDWADGVYICGVLGGDPTTYIRVEAAHVTIKAATITLDGNVTATGSVTDGTGKVLGTHTHGGVTTGGGTSGPPV